MTTKLVSTALFRNFGAVIKEIWEVPSACGETEINSHFFKFSAVLYDLEDQLRWLTL